LTFLVRIQLQLYDCNTQYYIHCVSQNAPTLKRFKLKIIKKDFRPVARHSWGERVRSRRGVGCGEGPSLWGGKCWDFFNWNGSFWFKFCCI